jgi:hypothetical protein
MAGPKKPLRKLARLLVAVVLVRDGAYDSLAYVLVVLLLFRLGLASAGRSLVDELLFGGDAEVGSATDFL